MTKTPEEMAEEHANLRCPEQGAEFIVWCMCRDDFLAGYQAAKPQWISVKDKLPEDKKIVAVWDIHAAWHKDGVWLMFNR